MENFLEFISIFIFGYWIGMNITMLKVRKEIFSLAKEQGIDLDKEEEKPQKESPVHFLAVEQHGDTLYLFNQTTDVFMTQGLSIDELATNLYKYKQVDMAVVKHGENSFYFIKGKVSSEQYES